MKLEISVVVPFFNAERYISACIKSLLSQSYPPDRYEIIMIDNNSTDRSTEIVKQYSSIKLHFEPKPGAYAARNHGIKQSKGDIIAFTDPDCIPSFDWLAKISMVMESTMINAVIGYREPANISSFLSILGAYGNAKDEYIFNSEFNELYYGSNNNMAVRREVFGGLGLYLEKSRGSDTIFIRNIVDVYSCHSVVYCPEIRVRHMEIDNILTYFRKMLIYGRSNKKYRRIVDTRPLNGREKILVFRRTVESHNYNLNKSVILFVLITLSFFFGKLGILFSIFSFRKNISNE